MVTKKAVEKEAEDNRLNQAGSNMCAETPRQITLTDRLYQRRSKLANDLLAIDDALELLRIAPGAERLAEIIKGQQLLY